MSQKSNKLWATVKSRIAAGDFPAVFVTGAGKLALDGLQHAAELPGEIAALYPAEIRAAAEAKAAKRAEARKVANARHAGEAAERQAKRQAVIDQFGGKRIWRLAGFFMEDTSGERFTFEEIRQWLDWDAYNLRHDGASVAVVCERGETAGGDFRLDISEHFANPCNDRVRTPSFSTLLRRLKEYLAMRRANASVNN